LGSEITEGPIYSTGPSRSPGFLVSTPCANFYIKYSTMHKAIYVQKLVPTFSEGVAWSAQRIPTAVNIDSLDPEPLLFHSSSSSVIIW
jgi:hypothetical protein